MGRGFVVRFIAWVRCGHLQNVVDTPGTKIDNRFAAIHPCHVWVFDG